MFEQLPKKDFVPAIVVGTVIPTALVGTAPDKIFVPAIIVGTIFPTMIVATAVFFLSVFHSVSNFLGIQLANSLVSGSGSDIPLIQDIETSNSRARLSQATLTFFSLAEQCHTLNLRCFKSNFDAVKSKFDLLIE